MATQGLSQPIFAVSQKYQFIGKKEELAWDVYKVCVEWCKKEEIRTIADLENRIVPQGEYERLWYARCEKLEQELKRKRKSALKKTLRHKIRS